MLRIDKLRACGGVSDARAGGATHRNARRAFSLLESTVAITVLGIIVSMGMPTVQRAMEQSRLNIAAANLRAVWAAERLYWLDHQTYTPNFSDLSGLLDPSIASSSVFYVYSISSSANSTSFSVSATRTGSSAWSGGLAIDQTGTITGSVSGDGTTLTPGFQ